MAGYDLPVRAIRQQVASALELIVHLERMSDGTRRVTHISEVLRMEGEVVTTQDLFRFELAEITGDGAVVGALRWTGLRPAFVPRLDRRGIALPSAMKGPHQEVAKLAARFGDR
jgi:pilus assembly protein CpaF